MACRDIVRTHSRVIGPWPDAAEAALDRHSANYQRLVEILVATPSSGLAECQAKARALRTCPDDASLVLSMLNDLEALA
jgi:hypothetical protein